jgi:hypothetical protein
VGKPDGRPSFERRRHRWKDNILMDLREVGLGVRTGSILLMIGTGCGLLCMR